MRISYCLNAFALALAAIMPARADWTFHSFPLSNIDGFDLAAREDTLYLLSSYPWGLYRSRDDGRTWELLDDPLLNGDYFGVEADGGEVFFFGGGGILRSRDNGASWQRAVKGAEGAAIEYIFPIGPILYATSNAGTFRSADRGDSWTKVHPAMDPEFSSMSQVGGILYAGCVAFDRDSSLFLSTDNGLSWKLAPVPDQVPDFLGTMTSHGGYLYATSLTQGLLRARPDSSGWTRLQVDAGVTWVSRTWSDGGKLHAYAKGSLYQSSDAGTTWSPRGAVEGGGELLLVEGARLFRRSEGYEVNESRDNGASWARLDLPKRQTDQLEHLFASGPNLIAYRRAGKSYPTRDLGRTWSGPFGNDLHALSETGGRLFSTAGYGTYQYSEDHGVTWFPLSQPAGTVRLTAFLAAHAGWLYSGSDLVYRRPATRESLPWEASPVLKPAPFPPVGSYFTRVIPAGSLVFAGSWDGRWQYSADSGSSWKPVDTVLQAAKVRSLAGGNAWVAATAQGVFRSPDGERNWIEANTGLDDSTYSVLGHGTAFFVGGAGGRIAYSLDQGMTWKRLDSIPGLGPVTSMEVQGGRLAVLSPLQGLWSLPLPEGVAAAAAAPPAPDTKPGLRLRSAVMRPGDAVEFILAEPAESRLSLVSVDGKRLAVLRAGRLGAGRHQARLDPERLRDLPRGRYLLDLRSGERRWSAGFYLDR